MSFHTPAHKTVNPWREAVIDQLVITHIYSAKHDDNPRDALNDLLAWNQSIALDPLVSYEARQLIEQGKAQAGAMPTAGALLGAVARGWCHESNAHKVMDSDLAIAIAAEVSALYAAPTAPPVQAGPEPVRPEWSGEAWRHNAAHWLRELPNTLPHAPYFANGMFAKDCQDLAGLLDAAPQPAREPLTAQQVWDSDEIMSCNAVGGLPMHDLLRIVRAIEAAHGIKAPA